MSHGKIVEKVGNEQVLHLSRQRHTAVADAQGISHARHGLVEIMLARSQREDVSQRLLRMFGQRVCSLLKVLEVGGKEAEHQCLYLLTVGVVG